MTHADNIPYVDTYNIPIIKRYLREKIAINIQSKLPQTTIDYMLFDVVKSPAIESTGYDLLFKLTLFLSGEKNTKTFYIKRIVYEHPSTWFQMFKAEYFPRYMYGRGLLKWFPVKYKQIERVAEIKYEKTIVYPNEDINTDPDTNFFERLVQELDKK